MADKEITEVLMNVASKDDKTWSKEQMNDIVRAVKSLPKNDQSSEEQKEALAK